MHQHRCPACGKDFEHAKFGYKRTWNALERIVARGIHRFFGACYECIDHFITTDFEQDPEIHHLETFHIDGKTFFASRMLGEAPTD